MIEQMARHDHRFIAREDGAAVACGALSAMRRHRRGQAHVHAALASRAQDRRDDRRAHRGAGAREGLKRLVLETGDRHPAAWTVYERAGFTRCGPVLDYPDSKWSVFYEKTLTPSSRRSP